MWWVTSENFVAKVLERVVLLLVRRRAQCQHCRAKMSLSSISQNEWKANWMRNIFRPALWVLPFHQVLSAQPSMEEIHLWDFHVELQFLLPRASISSAPILTSFCFSFATFFVLRVSNLNTLPVMRSNLGAIPNSLRQRWLHWTCVISSAEFHRWV